MLRSGDYDQPRSHADTYRDMLPARDSSLWRDGRLQISSNMEYGAINKVVLSFNKDRQCYLLMFPELPEDSQEDGSDWIDGSIIYLDTSNDHEAYALYHEVAADLHETKDVKIAYKKLVNKLSLRYNTKKRKA